MSDTTFRKAEASDDVQGFFGSIAQVVGARGGGGGGGAGLAAASFSQGDASARSNQAAVAASANLSAQYPAHLLPLMQGMLAQLQSCVYGLRGW